MPEATLTLKEAAERVGVAPSTLRRWADALPDDARVVKTIGDAVMVVGHDISALVDWAVGFAGLFDERPEPRIGIHWGVTLTDAVVEAVRGSASHLRFEAIGEVKLKGFDQPRQLCRAIAKPA